MTHLDGKTVFISGGSKGIGLASAKRLAADGVKVFLASSNAETLSGLPRR